MRKEHELEPIYNKDSKILILGSFPSVVSRKNLMYYSHPQNRFWKIISILFNEKINDKKEFILNHNIALWDVIESCEISGSSDSSIKNVKPNNIDLILKEANIKCIFTIGRKAYQLYNKYIYPQNNIKPILLSSTSPANAQKSLNDLVQEYKIILNFIK